MKKYLISLSLTAVAIAIVCGLCVVTGCSWQGHRHIQDPNGLVKAEAWSMRFMWVSGGLEASDQTPYWQAGMQAQKSQSEPNAIKDAIVAGLAAAGL